MCVYVLQCSCVRMFCWARQPSGSSGCCLRYMFCDWAPLSYSLVISRNPLNWQKERGRVIGDRWRLYIICVRMESCDCSVSSRLFLPCVMADGLLQCVWQVCDQHTECRPFTRTNDVSKATLYRLEHMEWYKPTVLSCFQRRPTP